MREGAACSRRGARAVLLCITCTCFESGEDSLLPWLRCGSVATRLFFCQLFLQGLQQMCKESVPIAAEHLHLPCGRTPERWCSAVAKHGPGKISYILPNSNEESKYRSFADGRDDCYGRPQHHGLQPGIPEKPDEPRLWRCLFNIDIGALWPLTHLKKPHSWCVQLLSKKYISRFINFKFFSLNEDF